MTPPPMRFLTDQCVPESVAKVLEAAGYEVIRLRERIAVDSVDTLVAAIAEANNAILVSLDADFKTLASRIGIGRRRFARLSLLRFEKCRESQAASRLRSAMTLIEHEWAISNASQDRRLFIVITGNTIRTHR